MALTDEQRSALLADGKVYIRHLSPVPPRDFVGRAQADLDATAENAAESVLRAWGFR